MSRKISFIGTGNMAGAIIKGIMSSGSFSASDIILFDRDPSKYSQFSEYGLKSADSIRAAVEESYFTVLSVKPQNYSEVLSEIGRIRESAEKRVFISLAAGISTDLICKKIGTEVPVIRTMPNTPLLIGYGVTALCRNGLVTDDDFELIKNMFSSSGKAFVLPESEMNSIISVTSSSPAYIYKFIEALCKGAEEQGIGFEGLTEAVCDTLIGAACMVKTSGRDVSDLIRMVTSPHGTTERAMNVLSERGFSESVRDAMKACTARAEEMARELEEKN